MLVSITKGKVVFIPLPKRKLVGLAMAAGIVVRVEWGARGGGRVLSLIHELLIGSLAIVDTIGPDVLAVGVVGLEVADLIMVLIILVNIHLFVVETHGSELVVACFGVMFFRCVVRVLVTLTRRRRIIHIINIPYDLGVASAAFALRLGLAQLDGVAEEQVVARNSHRPSLTLLNRHLLPKIYLILLIHVVVDHSLDTREVEEEEGEGGEEVCSKKVA